MRLNLSSMISLSEIPERYYRPQNTYEETLLRRFENIPTNIYRTNDEAAEVIANEIAKDIRESQAQHKYYTLALSGGNSPVIVYDKLIQKHREEGLSFRNVIAFTVFEYYPPVSENLGCLAKLRKDFLDHIDILPENIMAPDVYASEEKLLQACQDYESKIDSLGGIRHMLLGIGSAGSIAFNSPGTHPNTYTRLVVLGHTEHNDALTIFSSHDTIPPSAISMGLATIQKAHKVTLLAWGESKAEVIAQAIEGKICEASPASSLQLHRNASIVLDLSASSCLTRISRPWLVTSCIWNKQLIRRAVVWLCGLTGKPILKLTNKDYTENGLGELLAKYGSAYEVNIKLFNDIQHTITGWPGGKPNADDSSRPERALPYPKRVVIFSPHPDDDVISMGGTFHKLVNQGHDVHVAYQTSGNIAVGDEEVIRYVSYLRNVCRQYGHESSPILAKAEEMRHYLMHKKIEGDPEQEDIRFMKGTIRREEARTACRYLGLPEDHVHFLDLPFYETGLIRKNPLGEEDVRIIMALLEEIQPHRIFVAGDLADPHGTHRICLNAVLAAIDELKEESWFKEDCRVWMYRGAWAEWEIDYIEMAVPMSPDELRFKRNSILKHQSQMESAPFLGDDERLFWQRAEDRNRQTATLYEKLGLASYEAIEAFVQYKPVE
ncbi:glucosamine-6-phosphate deaminase [Porphyromonas gingivalis]|uniref:Glucosamine-6-phosphate deaminase n=1 Tax=Porphyromonas gingivalis TaxID=837 RepID=A0AAE9XE63_PORGN|nr:glucosamine-6-phosphate deaminase [Porphyromonas gingivalis]WCG04153.1 glucosamine-6-phosphate deaminase [Porphyromonas gingivalis]SJL30263.1 glucosamine-6-phosphate deaminase-like protein [Porphyromonas gingivalis]